VVVALTTFACGHASERAVLDQFFVASRLRDRTALARFSTVVFEPRTDGIVAKFVVADVSPERQLDEDQATSNVSSRDKRQRVIRLSLADPIDPVDLSEAQIALWEKNVTISAQVRGGDGMAANRSIVVTMQCARVTNSGGRSGRWIVVRFAG
jgi:hypothetical protein